MAAPASRSPDRSPDRRAMTFPSPPLTSGTNTPRSPSQNTVEAQQRRQQRHSKKLSINFPILVPARGSDTPGSQYTASPIAMSLHSGTHGSFFSPPLAHNSQSAIHSSLTSSMPLTPPSEEEPLQAPGRVRSKSKGPVGQDSAPDFLTLLASQERRVLELKEELARAETELTSLKKQWALYEAGKKKNEIKGTQARTDPVARTHTRAASVAEVGAGLGLSGIEDPVSDDKVEAEREKMREIVRERMMGRWPGVEIGQATNGTAKRNGQRVFSSSKHTRTLSLLTTATSTHSERTDSLDSQTKTSLDSARQPALETPPSTVSPIMPTFSRTSSGLEGLNFGKTYKDLANAATRKNLPQGLSPEQFVKQGKQMVDGVRDGLWNFLEDIRQATVGEEAITGVSSGVRRQASTKHHGGPGNQKLKRTLTDAGVSNKSNNKENESSFWKEFGMDTPQSDKTKRDNSEKEKRPSLPGRWPSTKTGEDFEQCCPKHNHKTGRNRKKSKDSTTAPSTTTATAMTTLTQEISQVDSQSLSHTRPTKKEGRDHHASKSSTDSRNPPSLVADLLDEEEDEEEEQADDDGWDNWDSHTEPGSPASVRKKVGRPGSGTDGKVKVKSGGGVDGSKEVQWHDLMA